MRNCLMVVHNMSDNLNTAQPKREGNHAARLAAVQALYQIEQGQRRAEAVIQEFLDFRLIADPDHEQKLTVNRRLFESVVRGCDVNNEKIDQILVQCLPENWALDRLDSVLRAILRAGVGEFLMDKDIAAAVIINEYMHVTKDFFYGREPGFVNGVLDHVARILGLKMKDDKHVQIKDFTKEHNTSGVPNWEDEGGS